MGRPPTLRKARTGLETPEGISPTARAYSSSDRASDPGFFMGVAFPTVQVVDHGAMKLLVGRRGELPLQRAPLAVHFGADAQDRAFDEGSEWRGAAAFEDAQQLALEVRCARG